MGRLKNGKWAGIIIGQAVQNLEIQQMGRAQYERAGSQIFSEINKRACPFIRQVRVTEISKKS